MNPIVTQHAIDRFREHVPTAETADLIQYLRHGVVETPEFVQAITGRRSASTMDTYVAAPDGRGIFVLVDNHVVTYLRMGERQQQILAPKPATPSGNVKSSGTPTETVKPKSPHATVHLHVSAISIFAGAKNFRALLGEATCPDGVFSLQGHSLVGVPGKDGTVVVWTEAAREAHLAAKAAKKDAYERELREAYTRELHARYADYADVSSLPGC